MGVRGTVHHSSIAESDWVHCEEIARLHGRTFFFASRGLPLAQRRAVRAVYAYCRIADDIVDSASHGEADAALDTLDRWEDQIEHPTDPVAIAFAHIREKFAVPVEPVHDLINGIRMDLTVRRYQTWDDLRSYCYYVAGTVGLMVAPILGCAESDALAHAAELGIAMQLTNILRDVGEDAKLNRLYLPLDEINRFGCDANAILAGQPGPHFRDLMRFEIARARALYAAAEEGIPALDRYGRFTTLLASNLYARILDEIEALDYDVFQFRAYSTTARKVRSLPAIVAKFIQLSRPSSRVNQVPEFNGTRLAGPEDQRAAITHLPNPGHSERQSYG